MDMPIGIYIVSDMPSVIDMYASAVSHMMVALLYSLVVYDLEIQFMIFSVASCIFSPGM